MSPCPEILSDLRCKVLPICKRNASIIEIPFRARFKRWEVDLFVVKPEKAVQQNLVFNQVTSAPILKQIHHHRLLQAFQPLINGLEAAYFAEDGPVDFTEYLTPEGQIQMRTLLENFKNFIARAGFRILQVLDTLQEFVGQYLLFTYLDEFVKIVRASMHLEIPTGRGRADLIIRHSGRKYIVETKVWRNERAYQAGKQQLATYLKLEGETEGYTISKGIFLINENRCVGARSPRPCKPVETS